MKQKLLLTTLALACASMVSAQWNTNANPRCIIPGDYHDAATNPKAIRTADGKTWIAFRQWDTAKTLDDGTQKKIFFRNYVQLLDKDGVPMFDEPLLVNDHCSPSWTSQYGFAVTADGCAVIGTADSRNEEDEMDDEYHAFQPAFYKIDQEGNQLWGLDGITWEKFQSAPFTRIYTIGNDIFCQFTDTSIENGGSYMTRISQDGVELWDEPVPFYGQLLESDDSTMLCFDMTGDGSRVRKLNLDLEPVWDEDVIYDSYYYGGHDLNPYKVASDGKGGAAVTFVREMGGFAHNIRVQYISADGELGFGLTGVDAYNAEEYDHNYCGISVNKDTEEILVDFQSQLAQGHETLSLAKFNYYGDYLFDDHGFRLGDKITTSYAWAQVGHAPMKNGDWIVAYRDVAGWGDEVLIVTRIDKDGNKIWKKTIGRHLSISDISMISEDDATYFVWRERGSSKSNGITIFRIFNADGSFKPTIQDGVATVALDQNAPETYYTLDGKRLDAPQRGLNIVRRADGSVEKTIR